MTKPALLDVNVLVALFDADHIHHDTAHRWFGDLRGSWATCPLTENGFVRVVSSASYPGRGSKPGVATSMLRTLCEREDHLFWPDSVTIRQHELFDFGVIQGPRQLTDMYLLALAVANDGVLVTFDRAISCGAVGGSSPTHLLVLGRGTSG